jgi:hypothetical protein
MKPENYQKVQRLMANLQTAQKAKDKIAKLQAQFPCDSDGSISPPGSKALYGLFVSEYRDGSEGIDLTGVGVGVALINFIEEAINKRIEEITGEIESL